MASTNSVNISRQSGRAGQLQRNGFILDHQLGDLPETGNFILGYYLGTFIQLHLSFKGGHISKRWTFPLMVGIWHILAEGILAASSIHIVQSHRNASVLQAGATRQCVETGTRPFLSNPNRTRIAGAPVLSYNQS